MKFLTLAVVAFMSSTLAIKIEQTGEPKATGTAPAVTPQAASLVQTEYYGDLKRDKNGDTGNCDPSLEISQKQMDIELDYFSRTFDEKRYRNAKIIYNALLEKGQHPRVSVHTWQLYDNAFAFPRVRRYDLVQHHMDLIQHMEDNLNQNFTNGQHLANFIQICKAAQTELNAKYHNGEFSDPALFDPEADHPVTWAKVKL